MGRGSAQSNRVRPLDALRGIRALLKNPDDTEKVFDIIDALSGRAIERAFARFESTETGRRLLEQQPDLVSVLNDQERLRALPLGTLGRTYADFVAREEITADGLVAASERDAEIDPSIPEKRYWFGARLRDMHDLWHVTTGYNRDLVGEAALLAFSYAQIKNRGIGFIVLVAYLRANRTGAPNARAMIRDGYRRGRDAAWLPAQDWESLLKRPLEDVRDELRLGAPPEYEEFRSEGAPVLAS